MLFIQIHIHVLHVIVHVLVIVLFQHAQSLTHMLVIKSLYIVFVPETVDVYVNVHAVNVGVVFVQVSFPVWYPEFPRISLTRQVNILYHTHPLVNSLL